MFNVYAIKSGDEYYYSTRTGGSHFGKPEDCSVFRSEKAAGAMIRKAIRDIKDYTEFLMKRNGSVYNDNGNLARWEKATIVKIA